MSTATDDLPVITLRVQSTQLRGIEGFDTRNRNNGVGVYTSYLGTSTLRLAPFRDCVKKHEPSLAKDSSLDQPYARGTMIMTCCKGRER